MGQGNYVHGQKFTKFLLLAGRMEMGKAKKKKKGNSDKSHRRNQDTNKKDLVEKFSRTQKSSVEKNQKPRRKN